MIAKITTGARVGDIAGYLHGPGKANEHRYRLGDETRPGGIVIGGNLSWEGHTDPAKWVGDMREALALRPEAKKPVWQCSLRNAPGDRTFSDAQWAEAGQRFAESMGFEEHPWVMVRHGDDHVHLVVSRVDFEGQLWARANDRWKAQKATSALEDAYGLQKAPRTPEKIAARSQGHTAPSQGQVYARQRTQAVELATQRQLPGLKRRAKELGQEHGWDSKQARAARFAVYDATLPAEQAEIRKLMDIQDDTPPGAAVARKKPRTQQRRPTPETRRYQERQRRHGGPQRGDGLGR